MRLQRAYFQLLVAAMVQLVFLELVSFESFPLFLFGGFINHNCKYRAYVPFGFPLLPVSFQTKLFPLAGFFLSFAYTLLLKIGSGSHSSDLHKIHAPPQLNDDVC